ncbi:MAG: hypothetical protein ACOCV4_09405 [Myxococcota bacterium]
MTELEFHPEATVELVAAGQYIEQERPGHGQLFFDEVDVAGSAAERSAGDGFRNT